MKIKNIKFTFKNVMRLISGLVFAGLLIHSTVYFFNHELTLTYVDRGVVLSKSTDEIIVKRGHNTILYLNVQFEKSGFRSLECDPTTYFSKKDGDTVYFKLEKDISLWHEFSWIVGLLSVFLIPVCCIAIYLQWLLGELI